jgi:hypothetical protein
VHLFAEDVFHFADLADYAFLCPERQGHSLPSLKRIDVLYGDGYFHINGWNILDLSLNLSLLCDKGCREGSGSDLVLFEFVSSNINQQIGGIFAHILFLNPTFIL